MKRAYIGVTGFMSSNEVDTVLGVVPNTSVKMLMIGVLASSKTLRGLKNKWGGRYPAIENIAGIFPCHPLSLNLVHFHSEDKENLLSELEEITKAGGKNMHGLQLNVSWPSTNDLAKYRERYPDKKIILQIGNHAFDKADRSPKQVADRIAADYARLIDYVLFDPSGGTGQPFDPNNTRKYLDALRQKNLDIGLGVAGGLCPDSLINVESLAGEFANLSIDAEGRLRDQDDNLNLKLAKEYVLLALEMFKKTTVIDEKTVPEKEPLFAYEFVTDHRQISGADLVRINVLLKQLTANAKPIDITHLANVIATARFLVAREVTVKKSNLSNIVGIATLVPMNIPTARAAAIHDVVTDTERRGKGIARQMMKRLIAEARGMSVSRIELTSAPSREAANHLYQSIGFELVETNCYRFNPNKT